MYLHLFSCYVAWYQCTVSSLHAWESYPMLGNECSGWQSSIFSGAGRKISLMATYGKRLHWETKQKPPWLDTRGSWSLAGLSHFHRQQPSALSYSFIQHVYTPEIHMQQWLLGWGENSDLSLTKASQLTTQWCGTLSMQQYSYRWCPAHSGTHVTHCTAT